PTGLNNPALNDTWEYVGGHWSPVCSTGCLGPAPRWDASAAFDNGTSKMVVFAGETTVNGTVSNLNDTWTFAPSSGWTPVVLAFAPTPRAGAAIAWDGELNGLVLFGGVPLNSETWLLRNLTWFSLATSVAPGGVPSNRGGASLSPDPLNGSVVLFGGCTALPCSTAVDSDTWVLANFGWHNITATASFGGGPPPRGQSSLVPAGPRGALLLFGGWAGVAPAPANDTWTLGHLELANLSAAPTSTDVGLPVAMSFDVSGGFGPPRLVWHGLPPGCVTANVTALSCRASGPGPYSPQVWVTATDPTGQVVNSSVAAFRVNPRPTLSLRATPMTGIVPDQVSFVAQPSGGTRVDPSAVDWKFGDGGFGVGSNPTHSYLRSGTFHVEANVTDAVGMLATMNLSVLAQARLVAGAAFSPGALTLGGATDLNVTVRSGTGPYTVAPVGALPGCTVGASSVSNVSVYRCLPTAVGSFTVSFRVNDSSGQVVTASANLTVAAVPPRVVPPAASFPWLLLGAGLLAAVVAGGVTYWILWNRRRREGPMVPPALPERPIPPANLYVPPEDARR
ncbi:MAG: PKD domain-containing protein, partial [Thermoplasmata archaeon]|nr:PKD domain-containing protein [Thermoplasmata archaeon]